jgi:uncharacterized protein (DUF486 family)
MPHPKACAHRQRSATRHNTATKGHAHAHAPYHYRTSPRLERLYDLCVDGHLKYKSAPLLAVIAISWGIALFEYMLQVPANRIGHGYFSAAELKTIQEVITLLVFAAFSVFYLKEQLSWNHLLGFGFIEMGAFFIFHKWA